MTSADQADHVRDSQAVDQAGHRFRNRIAWILGSGAIVLALLVVLSIFLFNRHREYSHWVDHTYVAEAMIDALGTDLERAETARRGYLLDRRDEDWITYIQTRFGIPKRIKDLAAFTSDNPVQVNNIAKLKGAVQEKYDQFRDTIELSHKGDPARARATFVLQQNQYVLVRMRAILADMLAEEQRLLKAREAREDANALGLLIASIAAAALLAALTAGSMLLMRRYASDLNASESALRQVNEGLEEAVNARTTELTRANEEIQRFAYIVSHDLRSPLVNVMGFTAELETAIKPLTALLQAADERDPELVSKDARAAVEVDLPESVRFIRTSTQKMDRLINAILRLSREGRRNLSPELLNMDALVAGVIANLKVMADDREAQVTAEGVLPNVESDRLAVEQVLANLVENAVKYLKPGRPGRVVVRGRTAGDRVVYEVEDNGRGIALADQQRVFDLFRRAGAQDQPGEGIGLAHVRALVYRLGGLIDCTSDVDQGATFRVYLPRRLPSEISKAA